MNRHISQIIVAVGLGGSILLSGCTRSEAPALAQQVAATEAKPPAPARDYVSLRNPGSQQMPAPQQQPELTPEEQAKMEAEINALYQRLDAQVAAKEPAQWQPPGEIQNAMAASAPNAKIERTGCAKDFCRYTVALQDVEAVEHFAKTFSVEGSILFNYPVEAPLSVIAYVFRPNADLRNL